MLSGYYNFIMDGSEEIGMIQQFPRDDLYEVTDARY